MENRYERQSDIVKLDQLEHRPVLIIGTGAIGRQVALQAAAMGVPHLILVDFDTVEDVNLAAQGFREIDLGKPKVEAVAAACRDINSSINITTYNQKFSYEMVPLNGIVMCAVDSIVTRKEIFAQSHRLIWAWIDGRMTAEALRVLTATDPETNKYYRSTLFNADQAEPGRCTAKTTIYCSNIAAGLMITQLTKLLRNIPVEKDILFNLFTTELEIDCEAKAA